MCACVVFAPIFGNIECMYVYYIYSCRTPTHMHNTPLFSYFVCLPLSSVLELIIDEHVEKLEATLRGIETLSVVARHTASKLTELIGCDKLTLSTNDGLGTLATVESKEVSG